MQLIQQREQRIRKQAFIGAENGAIIRPVEAIPFTEPLCRRPLGPVRLWEKKQSTVQEH